MKLYVLFAVAVFLNGCATYESRIRGPRADFERGSYDTAAAALQKNVDRADNDQLLYLMDLGVVLHSAGRYQDAINVFLKADKLAEIKDYTSVMQEVGSVVLSDEVKPYKGELFEKLLINVYLAIDYTMLGQWDDALVECRRVNHKIDLMIREGQAKYQYNPFAKYLAATLFEARREYNDAFVDYRMVHKWADRFPYLAAPMLRVAERLRMTQEFEEYRSRYPSTDYKIEKNEGEVVLLLEQGRSPVKVPSPQMHLVPIFQRRSYNSDHVWLRGPNGEKVRTYELFDIEGVAIQELESRMAGIIAKKMAGVVAKQLIAKQVEKETESPLWGFLTALFLHAQDKADLRSWTLLPAKLQLARIVVPAGRHDFFLDMVTRSGYESKGIKQWTGVEVKPRSTVFLSYRTPD